MMALSIYVEYSEIKLANCICFFLSGSCYTNPKKNALRRSETLL